MSNGEQSSDSQTRSDAPAIANKKHFTGVVLIHGLGLIPRNNMLQQALNALTYWFNHGAGLDLSPTGADRIWLNPHLTDDPDPDQPASRALVDVVAKVPEGAPHGRESEVHLEFREVWWAESFGMPDIGQTISWAQVQWREEAARLFIPVRWRREPAPAHNGQPAEPPVQSETQPPTTGETEAPTDPRALHPGTRRILRGLLRLYDIYQYLWKVVQWLILTPVITLLLIIMSVVRVLAVIPFLQSAIIAAFTAIINTVMLHWVAEIQVYLTDYTRSSAIRERFSSEVEELLGNPLCDRVVVIAESGGNYIAFEGLTTLLERLSPLPLDEQGEPKPVTFVSVATALRRIWLLSDTDSHRFYRGLPKSVKWLHFWARYDPVAAGPLNVSSLPKWVSLAGDRYQPIRDSLRDCTNFAVVNTDSTFTDHVNYWNNLEQVVGQIACELVAGHNTLERQMRARLDKLASPDRVLLRRWGVAWRYTLTFTGGIAAVLAVLLWAATHPQFKTGITSLLQRVDWGGFVNSVCPPCQELIASTAPVSNSSTAHQVGQYSSAQAVAYLFAHYLTIPNLVVVALALILMGLVNALIAQMVAKPTPFAFVEPAVTGRQRLGTLFAIAASGVGLVFLASLIFSTFVDRSINFTAVPSSPPDIAYVVVLGLAELVYSASLVATLIASAQHRQWAWSAAVLLALIPLYVNDPFYRSALVAVAVSGCVVLLLRPTRPHSAAGSIILLLVGFMAVNAAIGSMLYDFNIVRIPLLGAGVFVEVLLPSLIYGLWLGRSRQAGGKYEGVAMRTPVLILALAYLALVDLLMFPLIRIPPFTVGQEPPVHRISPSLDIVGTSSASSADTLRAAGVLLTVMIGFAMLALCLVDATRTRRWVWLVGVLLLVGGLTTWFGVFSSLGATSAVPEGGLLLSFALAATALIYVLWAGPGKGTATK